MMKEKNAFKDKNKDDKYNKNKVKDKDKDKYKYKYNQFQKTKETYDSLTSPYSNSNKNYLNRTKQTPKQLLIVHILNHFKTKIKIKEKIAIKNMIYIKNLKISKKKHLFPEIQDKIVV